MERLIIGGMILLLIIFIEILLYCWLVIVSRNETPEDHS